MIGKLVAHLAGSEEEVSPQRREHCGKVCAVAGVLANFLLFAGKLLAGLLTGSVSVTADALNNLSDAGASVVTLGGFYLAGRKADRDHPFGHGRSEYVAGLIVAFLILLVGLELLRTSVERILSPQPVVFTGLAYGILIVSVLLKFCMYRFQKLLSVRIASPSLAATAADSLSDAAATAAVLLGGVIGNATNLPVDGVIGVLVACFILRAGWRAARDTLDPLLGAPADPKLVQRVEQAVLSHPDILGMHDLVIHDYGPGRSMMSLHAEVTAAGDLLALHDAIDEVERGLQSEFHTQAVIHMDPVVQDDPYLNELREKVSRFAREIDEGITVHDFRMTGGTKQKKLIFDVLVPYGLSLTDKEISRRLSESIRQMPGQFYAVIQVDKALYETE